MKRLFITGGSGLLGSKFQYVAGDTHEIITTYHKNPGENSVQFDVTNEKDVAEKITSLNPDAVVHAAALTNVDYCEDHPDEAWNIDRKSTSSASGNSTASIVASNAVSAVFGEPSSARPSQQGRLASSTQNGPPQPLPRSPRLVIRPIPRGRSSAASRSATSTASALSSRLPP